MKNIHDISPEEFELIDQFLNNELSSEQAAAFAERLQTDEVLQQKLNEVRLLTLGVSETILKDKLNSYHSDLTNIVPIQSSKKNGKVISFSRKLMAAASVVIIVSLSLWWFLMKESSSDKIYSSYYKPDPGLITAMGPSDNYTFEKAMVDYKNGDYNKAIEAWSSLKESQPANDTLNYFLGVAYQAKDNNKETIKFLEKVTANNNSVFYKEACWYLGLAFIKEGQTEKAKEYIGKSDRTEKINLLDALNKK